MSPKEHSPPRSHAACFPERDHFRSDRAVKRDPGLSQLGRKCCAELVFQTPDQRITKRVKVRSLNSEICMLPTRVPDDRLKQFMLIKCPNDCRDHVHELEVLSSMSLGNKRCASGASSKNRR